MHSKKAAIILSLASLVVSAGAFADTRDIVSANNQLGVQATSGNISYTETAKGATYDTENGNVPGVGISVSAMKDLWLGNDYIAAQYGYASGRTDYVGQSMGGGGYGSLVAQSGAKTADFSLRYGKGFVVGNQLMVTPFAELGYHKWDRNVGNNIAGGYMEVYAHKYYGVGAMGQYSPMSRLVLSANALVGRTFGANIDASLPSPLAFSAALGNDTLYKVGASVDYAFTQTIHGNVGVDYASWGYGASAVQSSGLYEPDSTTRITTTHIGVGYAF